MPDNNDHNPLSGDDSRALMDLMPVGIYRTDPDGCCTYANSAWLKMAGKSLDQVMGNGWADCLHPDDRERIFSSWKKFVEQGGVWEDEYRFQTPEGRVTWVFGTASAVKDDAGVLKGYIGTNTDISSLKDAERACLDRENLFEVVFNNIQDGVLIADADTKELIMANPAICRMTGFSVDELCELHAMDLHPEKSRYKIKGVFERQVEGDISLVTDIPVLKKDGSIMYCDINSKPGVIGDRKCLIGAFRDVSEKRKVLHDYRQLFNSMISGFALHEMIFDESGNPIDYRFIDVNPAFEKLTGLKAKDIIGKTVRTQIPDIEDYWIQVYGDVVKNNKTVTLENYAEPIGKYFFVTAYPAGDNRFITLFMDVTELTQSKEFLIESEERFRLAMDATTDGVWDWDCDSGVVYYSPAWGRILGIDDLLPRYEEWESRIHPDDRALVLESLGDHLEGKTDSWEKEHRLKTGPGAYKWILGRGRVALRHEDGRPRRMVGVMSDISGRKRMEDQLLREDRLNALGRLASGLAHDFNNILMPIVGFSDLLVEKPDEYLDDREVLLSMLKEIRQAANDARHIVKRLCLVHSLDEDMRDVNVVEVINGAVSLTRSTWKEEASAQGRYIEVKKNIMEPDGVIIGNESELREALINLILNSVDAMPEGGRITIDGVSELHCYKILFSDTGTGMTEEELDKCLEPFHTAKGPKGSGLGLAMVNGIVERHNGVLTIDSTPGGGTVVKILLPYAGRHLPKKHVEQVSVPVLKILLVDDDPVSLCLAESLLRADGHAVRAETGGEAGIAAIKESTYDLVISDRAMPDIHGDKVLAEARSRDSNVMTVLLTGFGGIMKDQGEIPPGVDKVMSKPVTRSDFQNVIQKLLKARSGSKP